MPNAKPQPSSVARTAEANVWHVPQPSEGGIRYLPALKVPAVRGGGLPLSLRFCEGLGGGVR